MLPKNQLRNKIMARNQAHALDYAREYRRKNRTKILQKRRQRYSENPAKHYEREKKYMDAHPKFKAKKKIMSELWRKKNRKRVTALERLRRHKNRESHNAYRRNYRMANRERFLSQRKAWYKNHREMMCVKGCAYAATGQYRHSDIVLTIFSLRRKMNLLIRGMK